MQSNKIQSSHTKLGCAQLLTRHHRQGCLQLRLRYVWWCDIVCMMMWHAKTIRLSSFFQYSHKCPAQYLVIVKCTQTRDFREFFAAYRVRRQTLSRRRGCLGCPPRGNMFSFFSFFFSFFLVRRHTHSRRRGCLLRALRAAIRFILFYFILFYFRPSTHVLPSSRLPCETSAR